jgi:methyl-accepting chemotaxis protein
MNKDLEDLFKKLKQYTDNTVSSTEDIKKAFSEIIQEIKKTGKPTDDFSKKISKLIADEKRLKKVFDDINKAIENGADEYKDINDEVKEHLKSVKELVKEYEDLESSLSKNLGIMQKIQDLLKQETQTLSKEKTIIDKIDKARETSQDENRKNLAFSENTLRKTLSTLNEQIDYYKQILDYTKLAKDDGVANVQNLLKENEYLSDNLKKQLQAAKKSEEVEEILKSQIETLTVQRGQYNQQRKLNSILEDTLDDIDSMYTKYSAISSVIPIIGKGLSKQFQKANQVAQKAATTVYQTFIQTKNPIQALNAGMNVMTQGLGGFGAAASILALALVGVYKLFSNIDKKAAEISEKTGLSANQSYRLYKTTLKTQTLYSNQLSTMEDIEAVQTRLVGETGKLLKYNTTLLAKVSDLGINFGYNAETAGQLHSVFMQLAGNMPLEQAEELSVKMQYMLGSMAEAHKIAPGIVAKDLVENSDFVARAFAGMPEKAMRAAIEVRKLGYSLAQAAKTSDHLFDITGSLTSQMEASVALGRLVDLSAARRYALEGKTADMMREITHQMGTYNDFTNMSVPQRMLLARSMGMEVGELQRSMFIRQELADLSEEERAKVIDNLKNTEGVLDMNAEQLKIASAQVNKVKEFNVAMEKIKMALIDTVLPLAETIVPLFGTLAKLVNLLLFPLKIIKYIFESIGFVVEKIVSGIKGLGDNAIVKTFEKIGNALSGADKNLSNMSENSSDTAKWVTGIAGTLALMTKTGRGLMGKMITGPFKMAGKLMKMPFAKGRGRGGVSSKPTGKIISTAPKGTGPKSLTMWEKIVGRSYKGGQMMKGGRRAMQGGQRAGGLVQSLSSFLPKLQTGFQSLSTKAGSLYAKAANSGLAKKAASIGTKLGSKAGLKAGIKMASSFISKASVVGTVVEAFAEPLYDMYKGTAGFSGGLVRDAGNLIAQVGANVVSSLDQLSSGYGLFMDEGVFTKLGNAIGTPIIEGLSILEQEKLRSAYRAKTNKEIGITKEDNEKLIQWVKQNSEYLKTEGGLQSTMRSFEASPEVRESIQTIKKETEIQNKSTDITQLNNNMRELIELNRMSLVQDKKIVIPFDDGTVRHIQQRSKQLGAV